jgi:uncharacterized protein (DUF302 family)
VQDYGRRVVVDLAFDRAVHETVEAFQAEGLDVTARVDVSDYAQSRLHHDLRRYVLLHALPASLTMEALQHDLDAGSMLTATVAIYELADGETAIVAAEPFAPLVGDLAWQTAAPELARVAEQEGEQVARALRRVQRAPSQAQCGTPDVIYA